MSTGNEFGKHEFRVELDGIPLTEALAKNMCTSVKKVVLTEIAAMDFEGEYSVKSLPKQIAASLGGHTGGAAIKFQK